MIGVKMVSSQQGLGIFLFTTVTRTALGPTKSPVHLVSGALSLRVKQPGHEANLSPPSSAEFKNARSYTFTPQYVFMAWCLIKHRDNFTFTLPSYQCLKTFLVTYFLCLKNKLVCRILARWVSDLEEAVQSGQMAAFPSQLLLEGYASSEVD
jgi:hypothetical protein